MTYRVAAQMIDTPPVFFIVSQLSHLPLCPVLPIELQLPAGPCGGGAEVE